MIFSGTFFSIKILFLVLIIPLTNSAITDIINADHRLAPLMPIAAYLVAYGFSKSIDVCIKLGFLFKAARVVLVSVFLSIFFYETVNFFTLEPASTNMFRRGGRANIYQDFMLTHAINVVRNTAEFQSANSLCIKANKENLNWIRLAHVQEQFVFYPVSYTHLTLPTKA